MRLDEVHISARRVAGLAAHSYRRLREPVDTPGMTGQYMMQELAAVPVDVDYASEFEYRNPMIGPCELSIFITQSGETADTTGALREAKQRGSRMIAITNVEGSTVPREADGVIYVHAGPEVSIASTKAFTGQMACLFLFALYLGQVKEKVESESGETLHRGTARAARKDRNDSGVC